MVCYKHTCVRPISKVGDFYFYLQTEFQIPQFTSKSQLHFNFEMLSQMFGEKFGRLATPFSTTLNSTELDSTFFSEMLIETFSRLATPMSKTLNNIEDDSTLFSEMLGEKFSRLARSLRTGLQFT